MLILFRIDGCCDSVYVYEAGDALDEVCKLCKLKLIYS